MTFYISRTNMSVFVLAHIAGNAQFVALMQILPVAVGISNYCSSSVLS